MTWRSREHPEPISYRVGVSQRLAMMSAKPSRSAQNVVGGLTEAWRIAWMAYEHNAQWVPHGWNTAIGLAADLQLVGAVPVARYVEFLTPSPYMDELVTQPFRPDGEGYLRILDRPGLGIELNREALKRFGA